MNIIFAGTSHFACPALDSLIEAHHTVSLVLTQPDRPSGRGLKPQASPVKALALQHNLQIFQPDHLNTSRAQAVLAKCQADVLVVAAYGLMLPSTVLAMPRLGCYNIHASLLPRWRGAAPIHRALQAGDTTTGVSIMQVVAKLDAGDVVCTQAVPITPLDTTQTLHDSLSVLGARLLVKSLARLDRDGKLLTTVQDENQVCYAHKVTKPEAAIDWQQAAPVIARQIRAFNPFPVAFSYCHGQLYRFWMASAEAEQQATAGAVISTGESLDIGCGGGGVLRVSELQVAGGKRLPADEFLRGHALHAGDKFERHTSPCFERACTPE